MPPMTLAPIGDDTPPIEGRTSTDSVVRSAQRPRAKLKRHPNEEGQSGEDTHGEAGENASQLASTVLDYAGDGKPWEKEDGKREQRPAHSADVCQWLSE